MEDKPYGPADGKTIDIDFKLNNVCTLCGGTDRIPIKPSLTYGSNYFFHYWLCSCGMIYIDSYPQDQIQYYSEIGLTTHSARAGTRAHDRANRVIGMMPEEWEIESHLDVGCGNELLIDLVEKRFGCLVGEGVEYDPRFMGSRKFYTRISDVPKTYDLVTAIHVAEHDPNPLPFLKRLIELADKYVVIEVPSMGEGNLKHVSIFNPWTLERMLTKAGLNNFTVAWHHVVAEDYDQAILFVLGEV